METVIQHLIRKGWIINRDKVQGPDKAIQFLGLLIHTEGRKIPEQVIDKIQTIGPLRNKKEAQQVIGHSDTGEIIYHI